MNDEHWDEEINVTSLNPEEKLKYEQKLWKREFERRQLERETQRAERGYFTLPILSEEMISNNFEFFRDRDSSAAWSANRTVYICNNCGCFGYKYECHELFKCYACRSRNLILYKSGEISIALRNQDIGVNMQDVFNRRKERLKEARRRRLDGSE